jgi:hypothetical protein
MLAHLPGKTRDRLSRMKLPRSLAATHGSSCIAQMPYGFRRRRRKTQIKWTGRRDIVGTCKSWCRIPPASPAPLSQGRAFIPGIERALNSMSRSGKRYRLRRCAVVAGKAEVCGQATGFRGFQGDRDQATYHRRESGTAGIQLGEGRAICACQRDTTDVESGRSRVGLRYTLCNGGSSYSG